MNGDRSSAYSRVFLVLGGLVVAGAVLRIIRAFFIVGGAIDRSGAGASASHGAAVRRFLSEKTRREFRG